MNKTLLASAIALLAATMTVAQEKVPAFPGAEGHGRYTQGGRGGRVIHVTNLDDSGEGSLRWALDGGGVIDKNDPKIIVFDVGGYIDLKSQLNITSNTTIAGQTAPGKGITLRYYTLYFGNADNVIVRFIRSRRSQVKDVNDGADATWGRRRHDIIIDHCSFSWSIDEVASFYDNRNFTLQWTTMAEGLANSGHTKGPHSYGGIWGGKEASFIHNFLGYVNNRVPRFNGARYEWGGWDKERFNNTVDAERVDFRNNVMYNWGNGNGCYGGPGGGYINIVNNYYKAGPGTKNKTRVTEVSVGSSGNSTNEPLRGYASRYYIQGNYVTAASDPENYDWQGVKYDSGLYTMDGNRYIPDAKHLYGDDKTYVQNDKGVDCIKLKLDAPIEAGEVTTHSAETAYEKVLAYCGASLYRDAADARYMEEARTGTVTYKAIKGINGKNGKEETNPDGILNVINDPEGEQNEGTASFPELPTVTRGTGFDTDGDGIPDEWETKNNLNPNDPADAALFTIDTERGWYSNLEVYLHSLVDEIMIAGQSDGAQAGFEYYPSYSGAAGIENVAEGTTGAVSSVEYYTLDGLRIPEPGNGISIRRTIYCDGSVSTDKVLKQE